MPLCIKFLVVVEILPTCFRSSWFHDANRTLKSICSDLEARAEAALELSSSEIVWRVFKLLLDRPVRYSTLASGQSAQIVVTIRHQALFQPLAYAYTILTRR